MIKIANLSKLNHVPDPIDGMSQANKEILMNCSDVVAYAKLLEYKNMTQDNIEGVIFELIQALEEITNLWIDWDQVNIGIKAENKKLRSTLATTRSEKIKLKKAKNEATDILTQIPPTVLTTAKQRLEATRAAKEEERRLRKIHMAILNMLRGDRVFEGKVLLREYLDMAKSKLEPLEVDAIISLYGLGLDGRRDRYEIAVSMGVSMKIFHGIQRSATRKIIETPGCEDLLDKIQELI